MFLLRRVVGDSMLPSLRGGQIIIARTAKNQLKVGDIVIVRHGGVEKIKRVTQIKMDEIYIIGDNRSHSTDSRHFGWVDVSSIRGKVVWPRK